MVSRNIVYIFFLYIYERAPRFYDCHSIKKFWQILKYFLDFKTKKNLFFTREHSDARNQNVNKFVVRISVEFRCFFTNFLTTPFYYFEKREVYLLSFLIFLPPHSLFIRCFIVKQQFSIPEATGDFFHRCRRIVVLFLISFTDKQLF